MKTIIIPFSPKDARKVFNGEKSIDVRKGLVLYTLVKEAEEKGEEVEFLMCVKGKIEARFKVDADILDLESSFGSHEYTCFGHTTGDNESGELEGTCLNKDKLDTYLQGNLGTALHIHDLETFFEPKTLADYGLKSVRIWCLLEDAPKERRKNK